MHERWKSQAADMLYAMLRIRAFEETVEEEAMRGHVQGGIHLAIGQEAVAVGAHFALHSDDYVLGSHRGHHVCLARGVDANRMMAELMGKETGLSRGKSSSMHLVDPSHGLLGTDGIVAANIGIATGAAFSIKYLEANRVAVAFFGEGSVNKGLFNESLNLAGLWKLPVIYICENNLYAVETHFDNATAGGGVARRAESYGFPGVVVDGMDVIAMAEAVTEARERAIGSGGPTLIEAKTYRFRGHEVGDPQNYRAKEEVARWRVCDPIQRLKKTVTDLGWLAEAMIEELTARAASEMEEARAFGLASADASPETACEFVYAEGDVERYG